jgi:hypothetical protein
LPHSEIHGSKLILSSPWLNAEYHVLHRLLLPRHPPNALIALDLIRKKTDLNLSPCPFVSQGVASDQKHVLFPPLPSGRDFLINSHAGTDHLVSVLDLDNVIVGPNPEGLSLLNPHSGTADNADYLSERCKCFRRSGVRLDGKAKSFPIKSDRSVMVEPNGFEPLTSCLQSRRSTN